MKRIIFPAIVTGILLFTLSITRAANHALLIGIGSYPGLSAMQQLEGPPFDVESLRNVLEKSFGFPPANVTTLVNGQASRTGILNALDNLVPATKPDDFIFLYFSGHGTSSYDPDRKEWGLDPLSGALMPSDFKTGEIKDMVAQLIIGTRDIKPRLMKLDKDRRILAVFDACFSELTVR
ncbi:MAG: caspase family protein, partial [Desulfobacteraceae bacterium]|nr:caspase family protein [Desulfobacteraceae bacterium]